MKLNIFSYRFAEEILQHQRHGGAWQEIHDMLVATPIFIYPSKSKNNKKLDVVQQLMNTYFAGDRLRMEISPPCYKN